MNITATSTSWKADTFASARQWAEFEFLRRTKIRQLSQLKRICANLGRKMGFEQPEIGGRSPYWMFMRPLDWDDFGNPVVPPQEDIDRAAEEIARLSGWVNLAVTLPLPGGNTVATPWLLVNERPAGSSYQTLPPYYKISPYRIQKTAWAAYRRALPIARAYGIGKKRLAEGLVGALANGIDRPHKLAFKAVATALPRWVGNYGHTYKAAINSLRRARGLRAYYALNPNARAYVRTWFHAHNLPCVADAIDMALNATREEAEPWWLIAAQPAYTKLGVAAYPALDAYQEYGWVVRATGREDYHSHYSNPHDAIQEAISAWKRQAQARRIEARKLARIALDGNIRATVSHSLAAGNCRPGTEAWMRQHGIQDGVEARHLLRYRHDHRVRRVLAQVVAA